MVVAQQVRAAVAYVGDGDRVVAVQSEGCAPIVRAFEASERFAERFGVDRFAARLDELTGRTAETSG